MSCLNDDSIGPSVHGCRGDFDFTLRFEAIFFTLIPDILFLCTAIGSITVLRARRLLVAGSTRRSAQLAIAAFYALSSVVVLIFVARGLGHGAYGYADFDIPASSVRVLAATFLSPLSWFAYTRSPRPSTAITVYLSITWLFDIVKVRTSWLLTSTRASTSHALAATVSMVLKSVMLLFEAQHKTKWLLWDSKQHSPEEMSGLYDLGVFFWLNKLFRQGYSTLLTIDNLYPLDVTLTSGSVNESFARHLRNSSWQGRQLGLATTLAKFLIYKLLPPIIPRLALVACSLCQPLLINKLLVYLQNEVRDKNHGYGLIGATALTYSAIAVLTALYWYYQERFIVLVRSCLVLAIYRKTTEIKQSALDDAKAVTLMSTDVERVITGLLDIHEYWAHTIQIGIACWLLYMQLGNAFATSLIVVALSALAAALIGKLMGPKQRIWMEAIQLRISVTASAITKMKLIKMAGFAVQVESHILGLRLQELKAGEHWRLLLAAAATISQVPFVLSPAITFAFAPRGLDSTSIFVSVSYITLLAQPLMSLFQKLPQTLGAITCLQRIQQFLQIEVRDEPRSFTGGKRYQTSPIAALRGDVEMNTMRDPSSPLIAIRNGFFGWRQDRYVLQNVHLDIPRAQLIAITGSVGSGKSTLCKALIGEVAFNKGQVIVSHLPRVGYCDQQPFLSNGSIRSNIIRFDSYDHERYRAVMRATLLDQDLLTFPHGDNTVIGSDGINLSGGQRQRLSIARALYLRDTDLLVFDDVLSGLDSKTSQHLFEHIFGHKGLLSCREVTTVLATHNPQLIAAADQVFNIQPDGSVVEGPRTTIRLARRIPEETPPAEIRNTPMASPSHRTPTVAVTAEEIDARKIGDRAVYRQYLDAVGGLYLAAFLVVGACNGFLTNFPRIWLTFWSDDAMRSEHGLQASHSQAYYVGIYGFLQVACLLSFVIAGVLVLKTFIQRSGSELHRRILHTLVNAPFHLLTSLDTGTITTYFSQDITLIDGQLPIALINLVLDTFAVLGMAAVLGSSAPWLAAAYPPMLVILWFVQTFYLRTSRQLRLLDLEAKAPLFADFLEMLKGASTIRAFNWTEESISHNRGLLDDSQKPAYLLSMVQRWLVLTLSMIVAVTATILVTFMTQLHTSSSLSGASLVTLMILGESLSDIVRFYTALETSIGAVARLRAFTASLGTEEKQSHVLQLGEHWPAHGMITMENIWVSYRPGEPELNDFALRGISLSIVPGEKVVLCGRTGSGKSSVLLVLLKMIEPLMQGPTDYTLTIDNVNLSSIDCHSLRQRLITIPQDPVFLPSGHTVFQNLDPTETATQQDLQALLENMEDLQAVVEALGGVDAVFSESCLSHGQRQIFSLGRAVLKHRLQRGAVLLLDEFSSSVDADTERTMMTVIEREFTSCTVIMVAHRLDVVTEYCNRVLVMDHGEIVEDDDPRVLGAAPGSWFHNLLHASRTGE